ncbi:MAG: pectinesterase family protein [Mangrovibacterium sp.]
MKKLILLTIICLGTWQLAFAQKKIVVAQDGSGDFTTVQAAINSLPQINLIEAQILVKDGVYAEKVLIDRDNVQLIGESKEGTQIAYTQLKNEWVKSPDAIGAAVLNITSDDVAIQNVTIQNTSEKIGKTAYAVYATGTRIIFDNCNLIGNGANTVCLMDYKNGLYYLRACEMSGAVDMFRAMGWCYAEHCSFYQHEAISSIWHAGITDADQKMVVKDSYFDGVQHFFLGRSHYDSQFFIVDCEFSKRLADKHFYRKTYENNPEKAKYYPNTYGDRYYLSGNKQNGTDYAWLKADNLKDYSKKLKASQVNTSFVFGSKWNPEQKLQSLK